MLNKNSKDHNLKNLKIALEEMANKGRVKISCVNLLRNSEQMPWLSHSESPMHSKRYSGICKSFYCFKNAFTFGISFKFAVTVK